MILKYFTGDNQTNTQSNTGFTIEVITLQNIIF